MARDAQRKVINGHEWEAYPWDAMHGLKMQARLAPIVKAAVSGAGNDMDFMNMDVAKVAESLMGAIDEEATPRLIRDMLHGVRVEGKDMSMDRPFNDHFSANYLELYQGLWFVLEVNLGDVFTMAGSTGSPAGNNALEQAANSQAN